MNFIMTNSYTMEQSSSPTLSLQGLPGPFCDIHLPKKDVSITLEDENGEACQIKYIADKTGLSAGWRRFSMDHKLLEGDLLVFHLVEPTTFKVRVSITWMKT